jgi:hypothetical protein
VLAAMALLSCRPRPLVLRDGLERVEASAAPLHWAEEGFVTLVSPIRPPTLVDGTSHIVVLLRVPEGATLAFRAGALVMPRGAVAVRVEFKDAPEVTDALTARSKVLDARQFEWTAAGLECSVFRPVSGGATLAGVRWRCGPALDVIAGEALAELVRTQRLDGPAAPEARATAGERLAKLNGCMACHVANKKEDRSVRALVQRSTDAEGLFGLRSLFRDEDPVERYRPSNANDGDPLMEPTCPGSAIDVDAGLKEADAHVRALCDSRRAISAWLDDAGREAVAPALAACAP